MAVNLLYIYYMELNIVLSVCILSENLLLPHLNAKRTGDSLVHGAVSLHVNIFQPFPNLQFLLIYNVNLWFSVSVLTDT